MTTSEGTPSYFCHEHAELLTESGGQARCPKCPAPYVVREGIWMLDVMSRPDRKVFDEQVLGNPIPLDLAKGRRLLAAAGLASLHRASILDVGCGLGDLTYGLAQSEFISDSDIYAFDHSVESLRRASAVNRAEVRNRVHFSAQDALHLFFADGSFDLVAGSAVLHHFLDYLGFLHEASRILKPGGTAVFAEPFFDGYFWPALFLKNAIEECGLDLNSAEFSNASIIGIVQFMARHRGNTPELEQMTDKHYFRESELLVAAINAGFTSVHFLPYDPPAFYEGWMPYFLDIYGIERPEVRRAAIAQYDRVAAFAGPLLPSLMSHFRYIVLRKAN
jgi:ubiquinone/menaquinone biosynthesis C-methylase UbiE